MANTIFKKTKYLAITFVILFCTAISIPAHAAQHYYIRPLRTGDTIYFDNSIANWDAVRIYLFNNSDQSHPFEWGEQPEMTPVENNIWKFEATAQDNFDGRGYNYVIFSNGSNAQQTIDLGFVGDGHAYKVDSWDGAKRSGFWYLYDTSAAIVKHITAIETGDTIYFDNSIAGWDAVRIYLFNNSDQSHPFEWGSQPEMTPAGNNIWEFEITADSNIGGHGYDSIVFSNSSNTQQTVDLGFIDSGYAFKLDTFSGNTGSGHWYVYDKSALEAAVDEASAYISQLSCLSPDDYAMIATAIADAGRALNSEIPVESDASSTPVSYWDQVDAELINLHNELTALKATYGETPTVCILSLAITKTITNPQTVYRIGDTVEFRIDVTNNEDFPISVTITDTLNGATFTVSSAGDYTLTSNQIAVTREIAAGETLSLYATYPVTVDATAEHANVAEITDASVISSGYYLPNDTTAEAAFSTQSWNDVPVLTGIDADHGCFYAVLFVGGFAVVLVSLISRRERGRQGP